MRRRSGRARQLSGSRSGHRPARVRTDRTRRSPSATHRSESRHRMPARALPYVPRPGRPQDKPGNRSPTPPGRSACPRPERRRSWSRHESRDGTPRLTGSREHDRPAAHRTRAGHLRRRCPPGLGRGRTSASREGRSRAAVSGANGGGCVLATVRLPGFRHSMWAPV